MPKKAEQQGQLEELSRLVAGAPDGLTLEQITAAHHHKLSRRTLIRRLNDLVEKGKLQKTGRSRAARYAAAEQVAAAAKPNEVPRQSDLFVPLSKPAADIMRLVTRPLGARKPVGYDRRFLEGYRPNESAYLTPAESKHLADLGRTAMPAGPAGTYAQHILQRLLIDLSWNSSRLEGNTYSLLDTERLIEFGETT